MESNSTESRYKTVYSPTSYKNQTEMRQINTDGAAESALAMAQKNQDIMTQMLPGNVMIVSKTPTYKSREITDPSNTNIDDYFMDSDQQEITNRLLQHDGSQNKFNAQINIFKKSNAFFETGGIDTETSKYKFKIISNEDLRAYNPLSKIKMVTTQNENTPDSTLLYPNSPINKDVMEGLKLKLDDTNKFNSNP